MANFHSQLIFFRNTLGYRSETEGLCNMVREGAVNLFLAGCSYHDIFKWIDANALRGKELLEKAHQAVKSKTPLTEQDQAVLNSAAFIDSNELYAHPQYYTTLFDRPLNQPCELLSRYAQPLALEKKGGRVLLASFFGIYNRMGLLQYFQMMNEMANKAHHDFVLNLSSHDHAIALCFSQKNKEWELIDANQPFLPHVMLRERFSLTNLELINFVVNSFEMSPSTAFYSQLFCTRQNFPYMRGVVFQSLLLTPEFRSLHALNPTRVAERTFDSKTHEAVTLLHLAVVWGNLAELRKLVKYNKSSITPDIIKSIALCALQQGYVEIIRFLHMNLFLNLENLYSKDEPLFPEVGKFGQISLIQYLLEKAPLKTKILKLNQTNKYGETLIHFAATYGYTEMASYLINYKDSDGNRIINLNQTNHKGETALHLASQSGHGEIVRALMQAKTSDGQPQVDINQSDIDGHTPLIYALKHNHLDIVTELLKPFHYNPVDVTDLDKILPIDFLIMACNKYIEGLKYILKTLQSHGIATKALINRAMAFAKIKNDLTTYKNLEYIGSISLETEIKSNTILP